MRISGGIVAYLCISGMGGDAGIFARIINK